MTLAVARGMNFTETILARRSVRSYLPKPVDKERVLSLLASAVQAPSAMNSQPWLFAVIQDRARLKRYSDLAKQRLLASAAEGTQHQRYADMLRDETFNIFYDAGTLIVIGCATRNRFTEADCWLAAEHLMLAARAEGLGTCCIGFALDALNTEALKAELNIPPEGEAVAAIIVGYAKEFPPPVVRAAPKICAWFLENDAAPAEYARYALEHPAGFLATRAAPPVGESVGHPLIKDDPGFGAVGRRHLSEGERELSLSTPLPEALLARKER